MTWVLFPRINSNNLSILNTNLLNLHSRRLQYIQNIFLFLYLSVSTSGSDSPEANRVYEVFCDSFYYQGNDVKYCKSIEDIPTKLHKLEKDSILNKFESTSQTYLYDSFVEDMHAADNILLGMG